VVHFCITPDRGRKSGFFEVLYAEVGAALPKENNDLGGLIYIGTEGLKFEKRR